MDDIKGNIDQLKAGFKPNQERNPDGTWGNEGSDVKNISKKLSKLTELPKTPQQKTDKHGRIIEGKVHLYHSTNGLENLNNIVENGVNLDKQTAVEGLFFAKLGSPYRKFDSFVVLEMDIEDVPWSSRFEGSEVAFGRVPNYKMVLASKLSPEDLRTIKMLNRALNKNGLKYLEKSLANYNKYNGADNEVNKVIRSIIDSEKETKAGYRDDQERASDGRWGKKPGKAENPKDRPCFKEWFEGSKMVDENGEPKEFFHGTTHEFDTFGKSRGNLENDFGIGNYFTSDMTDVVRNYKGEGADLRSRIERLAEQIRYDEHPDLDIMEPEEIARKRMKGGVERVIPVFLSLKNPFILGGDNETQFETFFNEDTGEDEGLASDFNDAFHSAIKPYYDPSRPYNDIDPYKLMEDFSDAYFSGQNDATSMLKILRRSEGLMYATDEMGNLASNEILRQTIENMGFDGIWDFNVSDKFKGMHLNWDTQHVIAFNPGQIKGADNETFCDETNYTKAGYKPTQKRDKNGLWSKQTGYENLKWGNWEEAAKKENEIRNDDKETALIFDRDGNLIEAIKGDKYHVEIDSLYSDSFILSHNHPNNSCFSRNDIHFLLQKNIHGIKVVNPNGDDYFMELTGEVNQWKNNRWATRNTAGKELVSYAWGRAQALADSEVKNMVYEQYGDDYQGWEVADNRKKAAQKLLGRYSERVSFHLANSTEFGKALLKFTKL